jgi:hypothetical protein
MGDPGARDDQELFGISQMLTILGGTLNIWGDARFFGLAARLEHEDRYALFMCNVVFETPGVPLPEVWRSSITNPDAGVLAGQLSLAHEECRGSLPLFNSRLPNPFQRAFSREVDLVPQGPGRWSYYFHRSQVPGVPGMIVAQRNFAHDDYRFFKLFGFPRYEQLTRILRQNEPQLDGLVEAAKAMWLPNGAAQNNNNAFPVYAVTAPFPAWINRFEYDGTRYSVSVALGQDIPLDLMRVSILRGPSRAPPPLSKWEASDAGNGLRELTLVLETADCSEDTRAVLYWEGEGTEIGEMRCRNLLAEAQAVEGFTTSLAIDGSADLQVPEREPWEIRLERRFHITPRKLRGLLRKLLRRETLVEEAARRVQEAIELEDVYPFHAILGVTSVVELVLRKVLSQKGRRRVDLALQTKGRPPTKAPLLELKLVQLIDAAEALNILGGADSPGLHALRQARNLIHFDLRPRAQLPHFRPAEAHAATLVLISLVERLSRLRKRN